MPHQKAGREFVCRPIKSRTRTGEQALKRLLETFFNSTVRTRPLQYHVQQQGFPRVTDEQLSRMKEMIDDARKKGR